MHDYHVSQLIPVMGEEWLKVVANPLINIAIQGRRGAGSAHSRPDEPSAQRQRRVFEVDVSRCSRCGAALRVLSVITDPRVIAAILAHLDTRAARAPPPVRH